MAMSVAIEDVKHRLMRTAVTGNRVMAINYHCKAPPKQHTGSVEENSVVYRKRYDIRGGAINDGMV
jgi:hypothetical protein